MRIRVGVVCNLPCLLGKAAGTFCLPPFSLTAESFGVSAQIGSGVVRGGPEVGFREGSTRVPPCFYEGSTKFCKGCGVVRALRRAPHAVGDIT